MTTIKKQAVIFITGLAAILLVGIYGRNTRSNVEVVDQKVVTKKDLNTSSCDGATQWTPHGPYVGPVQ